MTDTKQALLERLDDLLNTLNIDPSFDANKMKHVQNAVNAFKAGMADGEADATGLVHAQIMVISYLLMIGVRDDQEVVVREEYTSMFFDYMTQFMQTPVCENCQYPHDESIDCDEVDTGGEENPIIHTTASSRLH